VISGVVGHSRLGQTAHWFDVAVDPLGPWIGRPLDVESAELGKKLKVVVAKVVVYPPS
jgi:hypothetical protein